MCAARSARTRGPLLRPPKPELEDAIGRPCVAGAATTLCRHWSRTCSRRRLPPIPDNPFAIADALPLVPQDPPERPRAPFLEIDPGVPTKGRRSRPETRPAGARGPEGPAFLAAPVVQPARADRRDAGDPARRLELARGRGTALPADRVALCGARAAGEPARPILPGREKPHRTRGWRRRAGDRRDDRQPDDPHARRAAAAFCPCATRQATRSMPGPRNRRSRRSGPGTGCRSARVSPRLRGTAAT